jgi:hypothetical protein
MISEFIGNKLCEIAGWFTKRHGKESLMITRGWSRTPYLSRWFLFGSSHDSKFMGGRAVMLHRFHASDAPEPHDHPWGFVSIIISGGYWEETPGPQWDPEHPDPKHIQRRWYGAGRILKRKADSIHSIAIKPGTEPVTLILRGCKEKSWGFFCNSKGFVAWKEHFLNSKRSGNGCG